MSIRKRETKSGPVWIVDEYVGFRLDGQRDRQRLRCKTYGEAKVLQAKLVAQRDAMRDRSGRITLRDYVENWYAPRMQLLAASSRDTYNRELRLRIIPCLGNVDVRDIDRAKVQRMVDCCQTEGVARKAVGVLKTILNEARTDRLIALNPCEGRYRMPPKGRKRDNGLVIGTFSDMRPVFDALDEFAVDRSYMPTTRANAQKLAITGLWMGLRPEERYALDWADIDLDRRVCSVSKALTQVSAAEGSVDLKKPKTERSNRLVPIPAEAARRMSALRSSGRVLEAGHFIHNAQGRRVSPSTARHTWLAFQRWCAASGHDVPAVTLENMRHSYATSFLHAGGNVEDLSRILGHSDINTTFKRYVKPDAQALVDAVSRLAL